MVSARTPGEALASSHSISRSERNQVAWRFAELLVAADVEVEGLRLGQLAVEDGPGLPIADRGEGRKRRIEALPEDPRLLDQAGFELLPRAPGDPLAMHGRRETEPEPGDRPVIAEGRRRGGVATQLGNLEGPGDPAGLARSILDASVGASSCKRATAGSRPSRVSASSIRA